MKTKLLILIITCLGLIGLTPAKAQWKFQFSYELNTDIHSFDYEGNTAYEFHSQNLWFIAFEHETSLIAIGAYAGGTDNYFVWSDPGDNSRGLYLSLPVPYLTSLLRSNHLPTLHVNNRLKLLGEKIGKQGIWRYYNVNLEVRAKLATVGENGSLKLGITLGHENECASVGGKLLFTLSKN